MVRLRYYYTINTTLQGIVIIVGHKLKIGIGFASAMQKAILEDGA